MSEDEENPHLTQSFSRPVVFERHVCIPCSGSALGSCTPAPDQAHEYRKTRPQAALCTSSGLRRPTPTLGMFLSLSEPWFSHL